MVTLRLTYGIEFGSNAALRFFREALLVDRIQTSERHRPRVRSIAIPILLAVSVGLGGGAAWAAATNLVQNGSFALLTTQSSAEFGTTNNGYTPAQQISNWTTSGYNFVFVPNTADTSGAVGQYNATATVASPGLRLWGPNDGGVSTGTTIAASPTGGNYIASDGAFEVSAITQSVSGLVAGASYAVSFAWAAAQQYGFSGDTTDNWTVSLGTVSASNPAQTTPTVALPSNGFSAWMNQSMTFVATSSTELLSFLATGTPSGQPPFALLANVSLTKIPEPASLVMLLSGAGALFAFGRRRGSRPPAPTAS
jgi:hypothetical protein